MGNQKINIDRKIDEGRCPEPALCTVGTTGYSEQERKHICYRCWLNFCRQNDFEISHEED